MSTSSSRVLVALSGGVDSCVCVHLLREQGYDVRAVVMRMSELHGDTVEAARAAAEALAIPLRVLDLRREFEDQVIAYFLREYSRGRTPNPCVVCNPTVKFHHLLAEADRQDCRYMATGHYARVTEADGEYQLRRGDSPERDQSYMLYRLGQRELSRLLLPLAGLEKPRVREIAAELGLCSANKPDSQENCFIAGKDYAAYIERRLGKSQPGDFIGPDGAPCGKHRGIVHYTVGQRRGLGVALGRPVFVKRIDAASNRIYLADAGGDAVSQAILSQVTAVSGGPLAPRPFSAQVKIRSVAAPAGARIEPLEDGRVRVVFDRPQRAVAGGQSLVVYDGDRLLGGGFIE